MRNFPVLLPILGAVLLASARAQTPSPARDARGTPPAAPAEPGTANVAMYVPFCIPGSLGTIPCPCNNPPTGGGLGCDNFSAGPAASGSFSATGFASLSNDGLELLATNENNTSLTAFWQGADPTNPGGIVHGAGIRCVNAPLRKLYLGSASGGTIARPGPADPTVSARSAALGDTIPSGAARYYFTTYRDPLAAGPCGNTASTINLTNAITVFWGP